MKKYKVKYSINGFEFQEGEPIFQAEQFLEVESETDDLGYLFKDITELHSGDNLVGVKILGVVQT